MAQRLEQTQATVQTQQLSTMQVAVAKLVELPITELATRVRDEMVDNAALEESDADHFDDNHVDNAEDMGSNGNTDGFPPVIAHPHPWVPTNPNLLLCTWIYCNMPPRTYLRFHKIYKIIIWCIIKKINKYI